jgi:hypothetical protein
MDSFATAIRQRLTGWNTELTKALTAASAAGIALQPEDLEPALVEELLRIQPLAQLLPVKQATARVHEIARRTAHGAAAFEGELVANVTNAVQSTYDRPTVTLKPIHFWGAVSGFQQSAAAKFIDSLTAEQVAGIEAMANQIEFGVLWGNTIDPFQIMGLDGQITTNIHNHAAAVVTLKLLDDMIDAATGFRGAERDPGIFIASKGMVSKISGLQTLARINVERVEYEGGLRMTLYRGYPLLETSYVKPSGTAAPATFTSTIGAGGALPAGVYRYQIASVRETGEEVAAAEANCTSAGAPGNATANLAWTADANAWLYKIYRSNVDGGAGTAYLYTTIAGHTRDGNGLVNGNVAAFADTADLARPTGAALETPLAGTDENMFLVNLNPERGAAIVSLVNALGVPVNNLVSFIELARTRSSLDFLLESFVALQVPWQQLHAHARKVRVA